MIGDISLGGVYVPGLLLLALLALVITIALSRLLGLLGAYRFIAYRPMVDLALFTIILGLLNLLLPSRVTG